MCVLVFDIVCIVPSFYSSMMAGYLLKITLGD